LRTSNNSRNTNDKRSAILDHCGQMATVNF
jgi:hypothetical protein